MDNNLQIKKVGRISDTEGKLMVATGLFFDFLQFILAAIPFLGIVLGWCISIVAWFTFYLWFKMNGVTLIDSLEKIGINIITWFFEITPAIGSFMPSWAVGTFFMVAIVKTEDAAENKKLTAQSATARSFYSAVSAGLHKLEAGMSNTQGTRKGLMTEGKEYYNEEDSDKVSGDKFGTRIPLQNFSNKYVAQKGINDDIYEQKQAA